MPTRTRSGPYTFGDFIELVSEDQKADLIDGVIYVASPENIDHNTLLRWFNSVLGLYIDERGLGFVSIEKVAYRLAPKTGPEPDLAFVREERRGILKKGFVDGPPDLALEIVSPDSVDRDYEAKRAKYEEAGVREYWVIDPEEERATFFVQGTAGFAEAHVENHVFRSRVVPGFWLDVRWLWQRPLPSPLPILQNLLADAPT